MIHFLTSPTDSTKKIDGVNFPQSFNPNFQQVNITCYDMIWYNNKE